MLPRPELYQDPFALLKVRSEEHTSELQSRLHLVCRLLLEKKKTQSVDSNLKAPRQALLTHLIQCCPRALSAMLHTPPAPALHCQQRQPQRRRKSTPNDNVA